MRYGRDGTPRPNGLLQALEIDAVAILRNRKGTSKAMRERLSARSYLMQHGWTVDEINEAASREDACE